MTTMFTEVYDAFLDAGASDEKSRKAAEALSAHEDRFDDITRAIDELGHRLDRRITEVENRLERRVDRTDAELVLHRWMIGAVLTLEIAILLKLFIH